MQYTVSFPTGDADYIFQNAFETISSWQAKQDCILATDDNVFRLYPQLFANARTVVIPAGEDQKTWQTVEHIAEKLLSFQAHKKSVVIAVGGGVLTDIVGFACSVYMRGIPFGFVPTTLLGMVDAAIGGKNGVSLGLHKNMLGTIKQPGFILFDTTFLQTLAAEDWSNGFAEIIKYGYLFDPGMVRELTKNDLLYYRNDGKALLELIQKCVNWKNKIVLADEKESRLRKLLNFGHTAGHAIELVNDIPHGYAVAVGMVISCLLAEKENHLDKKTREGLVQLLQRYHLPTAIDFDISKVMSVLRMDKKRDADAIDYVLLDDIGRAVIKPVPFPAIEQTLSAYLNGYNN